MCEDGATVVATPTFSAAGCFDCRFAGRTGSVLHRRIQISGKPPLNTANVLPSTRIAGDFQSSDWPSKTDQIQKDAAESENRLKHKNVNDTKQLFHSLFLECTFKRIQIPSGSHVALREPVAIKIIGLLRKSIDQKDHPKVMSLKLNKPQLSSFLYLIL